MPHNGPLGAARTPLVAGPQRRPRGGGGTVSLAKHLTARKPGTCRECGCLINPGDSIAWWPRYGAVHEECTETIEQAYDRMVAR